MPNDKTRERRDIEVILEILNEDNRTKFCIVSSPSFLNKKKKKRSESRRRDAVAGVLNFRERRTFFSLGFREIRLSEFVGTRRKVALKNRCLRVGSGFEEFRQTPRGRGFSLLGFYSLFKYFVNI